MKRCKDCKCFKIWTFKECKNTESIKTSPQRRRMQEEDSKSTREILAQGIC